MRTRVTLFFLAIALLVALASPAAATPGICLPPRHPHDRPLCIS